MHKIDGCNRDNVKVVLYDLYYILSGVLAYDESIVFEKYTTSYYDDEIRNISFFKSKEYTPIKLNKGEIIDFVCYHLLSGKDHPLNTMNYNTVKNYATPKGDGKNNPSDFFMGYLIDEEGVDRLTSVLIETFEMSMDEFKSKLKFKNFVEKYNLKDTDNLEKLFHAVSGHLAALINEGAFMYSMTDIKAIEIVYNDNKPDDKKDNVLFSNDMLSTAADDKAEVDKFINDYYYEEDKECMELGLGEVIHMTNYRTYYRYQIIEIAKTGYKIEFDAFYNVIALKKIEYNSFRNTGSGTYVNDNILVPEWFTNIPHGKCKFYFIDGMYYEFEIAEDNTIYRNSITKYPIEEMMDPVHLDLSCDKMRIEFYKTMMYFNIKFCLENRSE
ncbi:hypothetical protein [Ruminococcus albus]|uniref:hypothetical protein n=1 Tax=Ruminococcus albus TaxID=1264 RepID=UPI000466B187|nr:hypothetical protein [Ruminococcus albus]